LIELESPVVTYLAAVHYPIFIPIIVLTIIGVLLIVVLGAAFLTALGTGGYGGY
jgi:hypothetical protein